ncbi:MAG: four helix bundle suffix domain-containing protein [Prevotella sp.]|nr:four helix bundle suffix domain-containing protein [Prevotella sp.]
MNSSLKKPDSYRTLLAFQKAECVYDITYYFINNFMDRYRDRTVDQMEQAARSGKQNIVEGYSDAEGSTEVEHKLTVIAKGSLEELKEDYRDYLRTHKLEIWGPQHAKYQVCQPLFRKHNDSAYYQRQIEGRSDEDIANIALIVIHQTLALIRGLIDWQDEQFLRNGGIKEQRYQARLERRDGSDRNGRFGRFSRFGKQEPTKPTPPTPPTKPTKPTNQQ